jgi:hypothetical protein
MPILIRAKYGMSQLTTISARNRIPSVQFLIKIQALIWETGITPQTSPIAWYQTAWQFTAVLSELILLITRRII